MFPIRVVSMGVAAVAMVVIVFCIRQVAGILLNSATD